MTAGAFAVAASFVAGGCTDWFGDENSTPARFEVVVANSSDARIYYTFGGVDATQPSGRFETVFPAERFSLGIGAAAVGDEPGGCFQQPLWVLTSRSGQRYRQGDISEYANDFEIIRHFSSGECTDQEQIIVEFDGLGTAPGDDGAQSEHTAPASTVDQRRPPVESTEQPQAGLAVEVAVGQPVDVDGMSLVVSAVDRRQGGEGSDSDATVYLAVRAENRSEVAKTLPGLEVRCRDHVEPASPSSTPPGSTYLPNGDLPAGQVVSGALGLAVPAGCTSPTVWIEGRSDAFWLVQEPAEKLAIDTIDSLDIGDEIKRCMRQAVAGFRLSEQDAFEFEDLDEVASRAQGGDERAIEILEDFQTALAACN